MELFDEDKVEGQDMVGRLRMSFYGTRDASLNRQEAVSRHFMQLGFRRGRGFPGVYWHPTRQLVTMVHGDDYDGGRFTANGMA